MPIDKLDKSVLTLLNIAQKKNEIYVITNACQGWVETSSKIFLPMSSSFLKKKKIEIISARHAYQVKYPTNLRK
jgi:hypothetical protein